MDFRLDQTSSYLSVIIDDKKIGEKRERPAAGGIEHAISQINLIISSSVFLLNGRLDRLVGHFWLHLQPTVLLSHPPSPRRKIPGIHR